MRIDDRIILYLDNQLSEIEKIEFEIELKRSPDLLLQLEKYKKVLESLNLPEHKLNDVKYFVNIVPNFRESLSKKIVPKKIRYKYALAGSVLIAVILLLVFNPFEKNNNYTLDNIMMSLDEQEKIQLSNYYSIDLSSNEIDYVNGLATSKIIDILLFDFNLQESDIAKIDAHGYMNTEEIYSELQPEDADLIYNEILKTKFF